MPQLKILAEGQGEYLKVDPDGYREYVRDHKQRAMVSKLMSEKDAVEKFVANGDYLVYECNYLQRGPSSLIREVIRQKKEDLWLGAKFTWVAAALLVGAAPCSELLIGFALNLECCSSIGELINLEAISQIVGFFTYFSRIGLAKIIS